MPNRADISIALLLSAFVFASWYAPNTGPTLLSGDCAELTVLSYFAGLPHATGYPLYIWIGHLVTRVLPIGDVAFRLNLFSAIAAAGACGFLFLILSVLAGEKLSDRARRTAAVTASLSYAYCAMQWSQAIRAE